MSNKTKTALQQPASVSALTDEEDRRAAAERFASGGSIDDGRKIRRKPPRHQIGVKTSEEVKKEFYRLRMLTNKSYTDLFDEAIFDLGRKYDEKLGIKR